MSLLTASRRPLLVLGGAVALVLGTLGFAVHDAKARILQALGPRTTVGSIALSYPVVTLRDVRIAAEATPRAWPAPEEFHAALVEIRIDAGSLWAFRGGAPLHIADLHVADGALAMVRTPGRLTLLPALRKSAVPGQPAAPALALVVDHVRADRMAVDLYDATLPGGAPHRMHFAAVQGRIDDIALPTLAAPIAVALTGLLDGVEHDGRVSLQGDFTPAAHDANLAIRLVDVDMIALQPYLLHLGERPVRHGRIDLALDARVVDRQVHAPGRVTITGLAFGDGVAGTFAGVERRAVLAALARDGRIALKFTLEGRTDDPRFSLDESLGIRIAAGLGEAAGGSVKSVVEGVAGAITGLLGRAPEGKKPR